MAESVFLVSYFQEKGPIPLPSLQKGEEAAFLDSVKFGKVVF